MNERPTPPHLGFRVPMPPPPREVAPAPDQALRAGDLLDARYQIEDRIGEGGVGVVYRAVQLKLHRRVAVKLLGEESDEEQRPRFEREAVTLAALSHPNIVSVQDYGHVRGRPFLVMELLEGRTLRALIDAEGALPVPRALSLTREVLHALAYAHGLGIVHRDLKPANLFVQALPSHEHVKVLDFGFVKLLPGSYLDRGVQLSRVGFTFGTPAYMSPEHATGGEIDGRSDLYSLGVLLFEMLTGHKPFEGDLPDLIRDHLSSPVPALAARRPELAMLPGLQTLIDRSMAKLRDDRFADAGEFLCALDAVLASVNDAVFASVAVGYAVTERPAGFATPSLRRPDAWRVGYYRLRARVIRSGPFWAELGRQCAAVARTVGAGVAASTKRALAFARASFGRASEEWQARARTRPFPRKLPPPTLVDATPALGHAVTMVLDDPTHAVDMSMTAETVRDGRPYSR